MSFFEQIEQEISDRLLSDPYFENLEVLVVKKGNLVQEIKSRLAKQKVLVAPVITRAGVKNWDCERPYFNNIAITVGVFENVLVNQSEVGTGKTVKAISEKTHSLLHMWTPDSLSASLRSTEDAFEPMADDRLNIANNNFTTEGGLTYALPQIEPVGIGSYNGRLVLSCATPGAAIFWRVDGMHPRPRGSFLYTQPVPIQPGTQVKARAWLAGYLASPLATQNV